MNLRGLLLGGAQRHHHRLRINEQLLFARKLAGHWSAGYDRRKYIWKLLYIYMLGYEIDFGHKQACDLIQLTK